VAAKPMATQGVAPMVLPMSLHDARAALASGVTRLSAAGVASAALSAELLLLHTVGRDRAWLYAHPEYLLSVAEQAAYAEFLARRTSGVPTQYLTGVQEFWGLEFEVTPSVLIPRPETEHVVEVALERLAERRAAPPGVAEMHFAEMHAAQASLEQTRFESITIADVGTGSGCIAVALARELPQARIVATDISAAALEVAQRNVERHGVSERVRLLQTDLLEGALDGWATASLEPHLFDVIVSNPPYIGRDQADALAVEVREHEPPQALFGGATGLEIYARLIAQAGAALRPGGILVLEMGYGAAEGVREKLSDRARPLDWNEGWNGAWKDLCIVNDLAGIPRVISGIRVG
jgi:release factor glutamine methyltransferase